MGNITKELLKSLNSSVGDNLAVYDVENRKIFFFLHKENDNFELQLIRSKRENPVRVRSTDIVFRIERDGSIDKNNFDGLVTY